MSRLAEIVHFKKSHPWYAGIAAKLQFAFCGIALLTLCACILAIFRFDNANAVVDQLTNENLPAVKLSLTLENEAAEVSRNVAQLSQTDDDAARTRVRNDVAKAFSAFKDTLQQLSDTLGKTQTFRSLYDLSAEMDQEINGLDDMLQQKIARADTRRATVVSVAEITRTLVSSLAPAGEDAITKIGQAGSDNDMQSGDRRTMIQNNIPVLRAIYDIRTDIVGVENLLNLASAATSPATLGDLNNQFGAFYGRILNNLDTITSGPDVDQSRVDALSTAVHKLLDAGMASANIFETRVQELNAESLVQSRQIEMQHLSKSLSNQVAGIVGEAQGSAGRNSALLASQISSSRVTLIVIGLISIIVSGLVGWLFVFRYVTRRMTDVSESMLSVASGHLDAAIPPITRDELGDMSKALVVFRDNAREIVEARDAAEKARYEAESASRTKSAFLANMSHELRTPLNAIIGYSEMLLEDASEEGNEAAVKDLKKIENAGKHLLNLINDVLDLSKIEAGRMEIFLEKISIPALVEEVRTLAAPLALNNQNTLTVEVEQGIDEFRTDVTKLKQSLLNLVSNACKFTKNGQVTVTISRRETAGKGQLHFVVADTGIGMTKEQIDKLFQPFVQADSSTTRQYGGTGLGLVITKQFCRMLNGDVSVTSMQGKGSRFEIVLPYQSEEASTSGDVNLEPHGDVAAQALLLVDDDKQIHDLLGAMLVREVIAYCMQVAGAKRSHERAAKSPPRYSSTS